MISNSHYRMRKRVWWSMVVGFSSLTLLGAGTAISWAYEKLNPEPPQKVVVAPKQPTAPVPDAAYTSVELFLNHWFTIKPGESSSDHINRLKPYITYGLHKRLEDENQLLPGVEEGEKSSGTKVWRVDPWNRKWIKPGKKAWIEARVVLEDTRVFYVAVPVTKTGSTYAVSGLPSLIPEPKKGVEEDLLTIEIDDQDQIQTSLENFFKGWFEGNQDLVNRYSVSVSSSNLLEVLSATFQSVEIKPVQEKPVQVKAFVKLLDKNNNQFVLEYTVTLKKEDGTWKVQKLNEEGNL